MTLLLDTQNNFQDSIDRTQTTGVRQLKLFLSISVAAFFKHRC